MDDNLGNIFDELIFMFTLIEGNEFIEKPKFLKIPFHPFNDENLLNMQNRISKITNFYLISPIEILYKIKYEEYHKISKEKEKCSICQFDLYEDELNSYESNPQNQNFEYLYNMPFNSLLLSKCTDHFFHIECLNSLIGDKNNFKCPNCSKIYGILIGDMPNGTMTISKNKNLHCSGFENVETIVINYNFPNGSNYTGTSRRSFLPNTKEGREVLALLKIAFDRKLTFTVGTSVTTGAKNTVVWNGIHHKTSVNGGPTNFGYPDISYFNRVKEELASKGVSQDSIEDSLENIAKKALKEF